MIIGKHLLLTAIVSLLLLVTAAAAQTTAFTYQGKLTDSGNLANGNYDFQFKLFDALSAGTQLGTTQTLSNVTVSNGSFSVPLDFGACPTCFDGSARFLEIAVRPAGGGLFTTLTPRQPITSTPYAINAAQLGGLAAGGFLQNGTTQQAGGNFNISGDGTAGGILSANFLNATTRFNLNGQQVLSATGSQNLFAGINAGTNNTGSNNAFFGSQAGNANTSGSQNAFFGSLAGQANTGGQRNAFFGRNAGNANTTGFDNAIFGAFAGEATTIGGDNSFFGSNAGILNTSGGVNTFIGKSADFTATNTTGNNNTLLGALSKVTANISNATAIGFRSQVTQSNALVLGSINGVNSATADTNVGIGTTTPAALFDVQRDGATFPEIARFTSYGTPSNTILARSSNGTRAAPTATPNGRALLLLGATGHDGTSFVANLGASIVMDTAEAWTPTANGTQIRFRTTLNGTAASAIATRMIITNDGNIGIGTPTPQFRLHVAGDINTTTQYNLSGSRVLSAAGSQNLFAGINAGTNNTGTNNAFLGSSAGNANTSGNDNAFFGNQAGQQNTTGYWNAFFGSQAGQANTDSHDNAFFGFLAGNANSSGIYNAFFGSQAGHDNTSGFANSFFGAAAGFDNISGGNNTFIGYFAKFSGSPTGDRNTLLGASTQVSSGVSNGTAIGYQAQVTQSDSLVLGNDNVKVGIGNTAPLDKLHVSGDIRVGTGTTGCVKDANGTVIAGSCSSDARLKRAITPFPHLLDKVAQLQPVQFYWQADEFKERHFGTKPSFGLIAQEVEKVLPELVSEDEQGYKAVNYSKLPLLSLQAIKELKQENDTLKQKLTEQQQEMAAIKKLLCAAQPQADLCKAKSLK